MEDVLMEGRRGEPGGEACPPAPRYKGKMELFKPAGGFLSEKGCFFQKSDCSFPRKTC